MDLASAEITYGLKKIVMYLQNVDNVYDIVRNGFGGELIRYADVHKQSKYEYSRYNFEISNIEFLGLQFQNAYNECKNALEQDLALPAYDYCMLATHTFNLLDARGVISVAKRRDYMFKIRELSKHCAEIYKKNLNETK